MKAISIRQPWAWLIVRPDIVDLDRRKNPALVKDIENRGRRTAYRGRALVHAAKAYSESEHASYSRVIAEETGIVLPAYDAMRRGGVIGSVEIVDCVQDHPSRWADSDGYSWQYVLANPIALPFRPMRGQVVTFFEVDDQCVSCGCTDSCACPGGCAWAAPHLCSQCAHAPFPFDE